MTTPLKALIQERLRAKIVRQEVDGDEMDELTAMDHEQQQQQHHHHHRHHDHRQRDLNELQSPSHLQRVSGNAQRMCQQQPTQMASQYQTRESGHQHKRHASSTHNQQQQHVQAQRRHQEPRYGTNQKLIDYYTYEHHQKYDNYFRQDRSFGRGSFHDERYETLGYEADRSPLPSPWRESSAGNQFQDEDQDEEEEERSKFVESPRYAPPQQHQHQQHQHQRASSAELHQRHRDSRVHPVDTHASSQTLEASGSSLAPTARDPQHQQKPEQPQPHNVYESVYNVVAKSNNNSNTQNQERRQHSYPLGYFASQLYNDNVPDTNLDEEPTESHSGHQKPHHQHHNEQHRHHKHHSGGNMELVSPREDLSRKRSFGTFDASYNVGDASYGPHGRIRAQHRAQPHKGTVRDSRTDDSKPSYHYQQQRRHQYDHEQPRFEYGSLHVDDMVTSPLAAASSLAPLVFAAVTSPRLETKRNFRDQPRQRDHSQSKATSVSASAPVPLDMVVIEATRRRDDLDALPASGNSIHRRSSATLVRRLDAMLSPGCHRAATVSIAFSF